MATYNWNWPVAKSSSGPVQFNKNGSTVPVSQDTVTPANSVPLPVTNLNSAGVAVDQATAQRQDTGNTSLNSLDVKTPALVSGRVPVDGSGVTQPVSGTVTANQGAGGASAWKVDGSGVTQPVSASSLPLPVGAATSAKQPALGTAGTASSDVLTVQGAVGMTALKVDGSGSTQPISGTVNQGAGGASAWKVDGSAVTQPISASALPLPSGASTSALQTSGNTSLASIDGKLADGYGVATAALRAAAQIGNATGAADFGAGVKGAQTLRVVIATDQTSIPVSSAAAVNVNGSNSDSTVSTVASLTPPTNSVGFILMNLDTSSANIRWRIGTAATASAGQQLQPGRDTGYIPCAATISICAESGTQNYNIQWILSA